MKVPTHYRRLPLKCLKVPNVGALQHGPHACKFQELRIVLMQPPPVTNVEISKQYSLLVFQLKTGVILLFLMHAGARTRFFSISQAFFGNKWNACQIFLVGMLLSHSIGRFSGGSLARYCHCPDPTSGKPGVQFSLYLSPFYLVDSCCLGCKRYSSISLVTFSNILIELGSALNAQTHSAWYVLSCATDGESN